jgi:hypothetical protein
MEEYYGNLWNPGNQRNPMNIFIYLKISKEYIENFIRIKLKGNY